MGRVEGGQCPVWRVDGDDSDEKLECWSVAGFKHGAITSDKLHDNF